MFSDNGWNLVGANYKLLKEYNQFLKTAEQHVIDKCSLDGLTWIFIPPYEPQMGGLWEAAVKNVKAHLKKLTINLSFTFEEFSTLLIRIEAVLNSLSFLAVSEDPSDKNLRVAEKQTQNDIIVMYNRKIMYSSNKPR